MEVQFLHIPMTERRNPLPYGKTLREQRISMNQFGRLGFRRFRCIIRPDSHREKNGNHPRANPFSV